MPINEKLLWRPEEDEILQSSNSDEIGKLCEKKSPGALEVRLKFIDPM